MQHKTRESRVLAVPLAMADLRGFIVPEVIAVGFLLSQQFSKGNL
jgi:hypothetical protein